MSIRSVLSNNNFRLFTTLYIILISQVIWSKTVRSPDLKILWAKDQQNQPGAAIPDELIWNIINGIKGVEEVGNYIPGSRNSGIDRKIWKDPSSLLIPTGVLTYAKRNPPPNHGEPRIKKHTGHIKIDFGPASAIGIYGQLGDWLKQLQIGSGGGKSWGGGKKYQQSTPAQTTWKSWTWPTTTKSADWNAWKWSPKVWTEQTTVPTCVTPSTDQPAWTPAVPKWTKPAPPAWKKKSWKKPPPPTPDAPTWPEKWRPAQPSTWVPKVPTWSYPKKKGWTWKGKTTPPTPQTTQNPWAWNLWKGPKSTDATTTPAPNTPGPWIDVWTTAGWSDPWAQPKTNPSNDPWAWQSSTTTPTPQQPWKWAYDGPSNGGDNGPWKRENSKTSTEKYVTLWVDPELIP